LVAAIAIAVALWSFGARSRVAADLPTTHLLVDVQPATALLGAHPLERSVFGRWRPSRTAMALSPDGRTVAFTAHRDGKEQLYVRSLHRAEADAIAGTEGADGPFFSPDGAWVGFWAAGAIRKVPVAGGPIVKLCDATPLYGADWTTDGQIVFSQNGSISVVPANGGASKELTKRAADRGEARYVLPRLLPGGKWLMFTALPTINDWQTTRVVAQSLETGDRKVLLEGAADARYVPTGHLVYMRLGDLDAARFDVERVAVTGGEVTVVHDVMQSVNSTVPIALDTGSGQYAFSDSGALVYATGGVHADQRGSLEWIRRDGLHEPITTGPSRPYFLPRLSPNGQQIAVGTLGLNDHNLWRYNLGDKSLTRLTVEGLAEHALWSPDGARLAFVSSSKGSYNLFWMKADGGGTPERLTDEGGEFPGQWLPDGRSLVFSRGGDIGVLSVDDPQHARMLVATRFNEHIPDLSPDGRLLAYVSNESGSDEIYVRSFPDLGNKRRVSVDGGTEPAWSRNGKKLVFIARHPTVSGETVEVIETDVTSGPTFSIGPPHTLFPLDSAHYTGASQARSFDITPDASRFLFVHEEFAPEPAAGLMYFVQNWFAELQARVSGK
jgi:serine/threonine-protein kinase